MISEFWFKKISKMIDSEDNGKSYELNERFVPSLQDLGFIEQRKWSENCAGYRCSLSSFFVTDLGRNAYNQYILQREIEKQETINKEDIEKLEKCPFCNIKFTSSYGICADNDELCECDQVYYCDTCEKNFIENCNAHKGKAPEGYIELIEKTKQDENSPYCLECKNELVACVCMEMDNE